MQVYVLGFAMDESCEHIAFIEKQKPVWQKGLLNGIGGKVEEGETPLAAMSREFQEETSVAIDESRWKHYCTMQGEDFKIFVFSARLFNTEFSEIKTVEQETVYKKPIYEIYYRTGSYISNIPWLIMMISDIKAFAEPLLVKYRDSEALS